MSRCIGIVDPGMSVPELMNTLRHSFRESDYDQVQSIWMDREKEKESAKKEARFSQKKCTQLETRVGELETEREELKRQNAEAAKSLENLQTDHELLEKSRKLAESGKLRRSRKKCKELSVTISSLEREVEDLKLQNDELRREKIESDEKAESYKIRVEKLEPRIMKVEGAFADLLNVKVEDLAPLANSLDKTDAEGGNVDNNSERCQKSDGKGWQCKQDTLPNHKYCERHMLKRRRAKKSQSVNNSLPHLDNDDSSTKDDGTYTAQTSPGSQSGGSPLPVDPQVPEKVNGDVIEILDSDDESNCDDKIDSDTCLTKKKKRSRIYISDEEDENIPMENEDPESTHDRNGVPCTDSEDDSSCSDSHMNNLVATIRSKKTGTM